MAEIIQFPIKANSLALVNPESEEEILAKQIQAKIELISEAVQANKLQAAIFSVDNIKKARLLGQAIYLVEKRFLINIPLRQRNRLGIYRYPAFHILVLTHARFSGDLAYIKEFVRINRTIIVSDRKKKAVPGAVNNWMI